MTYIKVGCCLPQEPKKIQQESHVSVKHSKSCHDANTESPIKDRSSKLPNWFANKQATVGIYLFKSKWFIRASLGRQPVITTSVQSCFATKQTRSFPLFPEWMNEWMTPGCTSQTFCSISSHFLHILLPQLIPLPRSSTELTLSGVRVTKHSSFWSLYMCVSFQENDAREVGRFERTELGGIS
jgi:hypothetical protein